MSGYGMSPMQKRNGLQLPDYKEAAQYQNGSSFNASSVSTTDPRRFEESRSSYATPSASQAWPGASQASSSAYQAWPGASQASSSAYQAWPGASQASSSAYQASPSTNNTFSRPSHFFQWGRSPPQYPS